jgi:hypothetical protein
VTFIEIPTPATLTAKYFDHFEHGVSVPGAVEIHFGYWKVGDIPVTPAQHDKLTDYLTSDEEDRENLTQKIVAQWLAVRLFGREPS